MKKISIHFILAAALFAVNITAHAQNRISHRDYIEKYKNLALLNQEIYGIPASITMAQGLLESDCGNSRLALEANNHFGIKCKRDWEGESILHDDDEIGECFRKYNSVEESFRDHSEFLDNSARYQELFTLEPLDYRGWAHGLKAAGYATNPRYAELLIKMIEDFELYNLDTEGAMLIAGPVQEIVDQPSTQTDQPDNQTIKIDVDNYVVALRNLDGRPVYYNNGSEFVVAVAGDTYERISSVSAVSPKKLRKINDVWEMAQLEEGQMVYLRPKAKKANNGKLIHLVREGETMHSISQTYGIKLKKLASMNRLGQDSILNPGQQIRLM